MTPDAPATGGGVFRRILVGYDGSTEAQHALGVGSALAADLRGETHVLLERLRSIARQRSEAQSAFCKHAEPSTLPVVPPLLLPPAPWPAPQ